MAFWPARFVNQSSVHFPWPLILRDLLKSTGRPFMGTDESRD